jgi:flagellar hook assembly protein FlgD
VPNPFRGAVLLRYAVPREMNLSLSVYDRAGRKVKSLFSGLARPGVSVATWDGRDEQGRSVAQGVYFYRIESEDATLTRKAIKID